MTSVAFDKIVPFGQEIVLDDMPITLTLKERVAFFLCFICISVDSRKNSKSRLGCCLGGHIAGLFNGIEDSSAPNSGDLREEPVLYGIPFGTVWRIVCNPDVDAQLFSRLYETPFELPTSGVVGSASVTKDADALCAWIYMTEVLFPLLGKTVAGKLGGVVTYTEGHVASVPAHIVDAVRHHLPVGERRVVMVVYLYRISAIGCSVVTSERTKEFLLLRVHAEYGNAVLLAVFPLLLYFPELLVAQLAVSHRQGLYGFAPGVAFRFNNLPDGIEANFHMVPAREYRLDLRGGQPEPFRIGILRKSRDVELYYLVEDVDILGMLGERAFPASPLFADSALFEVFSCLKFMTTSIDGVTGYAKDAADKVDAMPAIPFRYYSDKLSRLSLVCALEVFHFLDCYYICRIIRNLHNYLEISYKDTNFLAD